MVSLGHQVCRGFRASVDCLEGTALRVHAASLGNVASVVSQESAARLG
jgi:hypothetical protein